MTNQANIDTAAATDVIEYVPLTDLYLSDLNPRQEVAEDGIDLLADSLVACGLIQNLAGLRDEAGKVGVVAGGRRLRALNIAVAARPDLAQVPVRMAPSDLIAEEWANAENTAREELDPVDMAGTLLLIPVANIFGFLMGLFCLLLIVLGCAGCG